MRVISGKYKGRPLIAPPGRTVRPTTDKVKEAVFDLLMTEVEGSTVLDLFAGSGSLGIEALSRGAKEAVFVDKSRDSLDAVKENLRGIHAEVYAADYKTALSKLGAAGRKFDLIFLDPPYKEGLEAGILKTILDKDVLSAGGTIVLERSTDNDAYVLPDEFAVFDSRKYGTTTIDIIKKMTKAAVTGTFDPFTLGHKYLVEQALMRFDLVYIVFLINPDKEVRFDLKKRIRFAELSTREYGKRVKIRDYPGMAIDFCRRLGIRTIVRGYRNEKDLVYETEMAEFNKKNGGIETILIPAKDKEISSTLVKKDVQEGIDISGLVDPGVAEEIKGARIWKI
jgi:16S rRNA (guanine(966)-N(2))-methyltransferase RsmD/pantetheine-phosphate adenylyltransferase